MLQKRQFYIQLKTQETNNKLTQKLVQGSSDTELVCSFDQDGKIIKIADTAKISLAVIYNGNTANYHLEPGDQDYGIVINSADGTVTIPFTEMLTTAFGVNKLFLKIDDTNISYAIGLEYEVIKNDAYNPQSTPNNLPSYKKLEKELDLKLNKDFSNSDDVALKAKLSSIGVSEDDTPEQLRDKLQTLKADNRLDNSAVKNSLSNDLADVDLDKLDEKFQATDSGKQQKINSQTIALKANADFSNISNDDFDRILVQTDMGKQILDNTKQVQTKLDTDMGNVNTLLFSREMKLTGAYQDLAKRPSGQGRTADEIKALFEANRFEEQAAVDFSNPKFASTTLYMAYQFTSNNQTIIQELPAVVDNKIIMVEALLSSGKTNPTLTFTPKAGDNIQGLTSPFTISGKDGYLGYFIPLQNENAWQFIPHEISHEFSLAVSDDKGNVHIGINSVQFKKATVTENGGILEVEPDAQTGGTSNTTFTDFEGRTFTSNKIQSLDKSLRISNLSGVADLSKGLTDHNEGIHAVLGNDQLINSKFGRSKLYFGDIRVKGGSSVYEDKDTKSYVVQDTDPQDDPNKTQGDIKFLADGIVTINYQAQCYNEQGTINHVEFWLEKVSDSSEVAGSHYATTIEAQRTIPKNIQSPKFTFSVQANETYRFYGKSNKDDGFYLQTSTVANPLIRFDYEFEELSEVTKLALDDAFSKTNEIKFIKTDGEEVTNKILVYNVDDGKFKLEDKQ